MLWTCFAHAQLPDLLWPPFALHQVQVEQSAHCRERCEVEFRKPPIMPGLLLDGESFLLLNRNALLKPPLLVTTIALILLYVRFH